MNYSFGIKIIGKLLLIEAGCLLLPIIISLYYGEEVWLTFLLTIGICGLIGLLTYCIPSHNQQIKIREGFFIVAVGWIAFSALGALPFVFSGATASYIDALFETVSGFTTTGASIFLEIEHLPKGILFWRALTHWLGGMGILVFTVALLPAMGVGSFQIIKAEYPGPTPEKFVPRVKNMARIFYMIYIILTAMQITLLCIGGMSLFDSMIHTFGTVATGGVSSKTLSIGFYEQNAFIVWVITIFMLISGINFSLYFYAWRTDIRHLFRSEEVRFYLGITLLSTLIVTIDLYRHRIFESNIGETFRNAAFQISSMITTTGFAIGDFDAWPTVSKAVIFFLFFVGSCAGSTGGAVKCIRWIVYAKTVKRDIIRIIHPHAVSQIKIDGKPLDAGTISMMKSFVFVYFLIFAIGTIIISFEGVDLATASSSVAITLGNLGYGFGKVGPTGSFGFFSNGAKLLFSFFMLIGRLELFTILLLLSPSFWKG